MDVNSLLLKINNNTELIKAIQENVHSSFNVVLSVIGIAIAITGLAFGLALWQLAKRWTESAVNKKSAEIEKRIIELLTENLGEQFISVNTMIPAGACMKLPYKNKQGKPSVFVRVNQDYIDHSNEVIVDVDDKNVIIKNSSMETKIVLDIFIVNPDWKQPIQPYGV